MTCREFLVCYSEFVDGVMSVDERARCCEHIERCASCARYHRVLKRGLELVRDRPAVEPSTDFNARLQHRIFHLRDELASGRSTAPGAAVALAVAGLIAFAAWSPVLRDTADPVEAGAVEAARVPAGARAGEVVVTPDWWYAARPAGEGSVQWQHPVFGRVPGPYSPLIVEPPVVGGGARAVLVNLTSLD